MTSKTVYQTDHLGIYVGDALADESPMEPGVWLLPRGCVEVAPPVIPEYKAAYWDGQAWQLVDSYQGLTAYSTETRGPLVIDRLGALPPGHTLEVPGPGQIWSNGHWVDDVPAVIELRYVEQLAAVNAACAAHIAGGLWSTVLGERHYYQTQLEDQLNLTGMVLRGLDGACNCRDELGNQDFVEHTIEQLRQLSDELTTFKQQALQKANRLKQALATARANLDLEALNAVTWSAEQ
ncbi:phage tail protein [Pseudomonas sp. P7759]|uniref:DUF4376 domain-containing protein n=1 Tax=Pseudomonas sp. P7759 TaxID=2738831 RepID=UPI0015A31A2B|nr:phage tail protein [Pseudomonas sp. P7759]NWC73834.1 phage tail protein [Pseudomonas sp. P7759]